MDSPRPPTEPAKPTPRSAKAWRWGIALLVIVLLAVGAHAIAAKRGAATKPGSEARTMPVPVVAVPTRMADLQIDLTGLGTVTPLNTVTVRTRVDGQLMSVRFREGQLVKRGDLLAEIDPRPFEAQLTQYQGQLERDRALLENARVDLDRYQVLYKQDAIPQQQLVTQASLVRQYEGAVKNDQGLLESIQVQLLYCRIVSPISGRVGLRLVDAGNIVHAADTNGLVVITELQPITVVFTIPEDSIPSVLDKVTHGARLPVEAYDRAQRRKLATGTLLTIDNQVDPATGTVKLKAEFPNTDNQLFPSQFVNVRLLLDVRHREPAVPAAAIQRSPKGTFVYVVNPDQTVGVRPVTVGVTDGDEVGIDAGLAVGEQVVVDGAERLRDGAKVALRGQAGS